MSHAKPVINKDKKIVRIPETHLVDLIDDILKEAIAVEKKKWISEQAQKEANKTAVLESRIAALEKKLINK